MKEVIVEIYGHDIVLVIENIEEGNYYKFITPEGFTLSCFKYTILSSLALNERKGTFDYIGYRVILEGRHIVVSLKGYWYVLPKYIDLLRLKNWNNFARQHWLTVEDFKECFGEKGEYYYQNLWVDWCSQDDIFSMISQLNANDKELGLKFLQMVMKKVIEYEKDKSAETIREASV